MSEADKELAKYGFARYFIPDKPLLLVYIDEEDSRNWIELDIKNLTASVGGTIGFIPLKLASERLIAEIING